MEQKVPHETERQTVSNAHLPCRCLCVGWGRLCRGTTGVRCLSRVTLTHFYFISFTMYVYVCACHVTQPFHAICAMAMAMGRGTRARDEERKRNQRRWLGLTPLITLCSALSPRASGSSVCSVVVVTETLTVVTGVTVVQIFSVFLLLCFWFLRRAEG